MKSLKDCVNLFFSPSRIYAIEFQREFDLFENASVLQQRFILRDKSNRPAISSPFFSRKMKNVFSIHDHLAMIRIHSSCQYLEQRAFPGPSRPPKQNELAFLYRK